MKPLKTKLRNIYISVTAVTLLLAGCIVLTPQTVMAAGCTGSTAPEGTNCATIPTGCPGSLSQGPVDGSKQLECPYSPKDVSFKCPSPKGCTYDDAAGSGQTATDKAITACDKVDNPKPGVNCSDCGDIAKDAKNCTLIKEYLNPFIRLLSALVGVAVTISIVYGGIQYAGSGGDPQKAAAAKNRIRNAILALVTYIFLFALLNFLIPGGLV